jgi:hypothetical protein
MKRASSIVRFCFAVALGMTLQSFLSPLISLQNYPSEIKDLSSFTTPISRHSKNLTHAARIKGEHLPSPCQAQLLQILHRQDCFRQNQFAATDSCPTSSLPFHNYAAYYGQGFGRIVEHTVLGCLFATVVLKRPCTLDLDCRDTYWTWRAFVNHGTLNWDWNILSRDQKEDIANALDMLPSPNSDEWSDTKSHHHSHNHSQVLPITWHNDRTLEQHIQQWRDTNKILLSPNWGNAWFRNVPLARLILEMTGGQCKLNQFRTVLQNSMYAPTSLTKALHQERLERVLGKTDGESDTYGAIHLRTILSDANLRLDYSTPDLANALSQCIQKATSHQSTVSMWWLIADNRTVADYMHNSLLSRNIQVVLDNDGQFWDKEGTHSGFAMKQKFFQEKMAPAMMDFMVLHESEVAIVTHGSFGSSGARGNGKVKVQNCAPHKLFSIYTKTNG